MDFTWKIGGEAGFGIMTTGLVFSKLSCRHGYHIFDFINYPSLIRGGHNSYEVRVSTNSVSQLKSDIDILVCLNKETFDKNKLFLNSDSLVIYDKEEFVIDGDFKKIEVPFNKILNESSGKDVMKNTIALGASLAAVGGELDILLKMIEEEFGDKGKETIGFNQKFAWIGFNYVIKNYQSIVKKLLIQKEVDEKIIMTGNDAFSLASIVACCQLYVAYPMTPASSVLATLAAWQEKTGIVVRHAEDEISVVNTALGASFAGVRASVGTSGGGFALMVESVALAGITETPLVIFIAQRPGPATGMPTWTEQADLLFAVNGGHGEFPKIVIAPGDITEMIELAAESYNLADIYQTPVIVMSDMLLSETHQSINKKTFDDFAKSYKINRGKLIIGDLKVNKQKYLRYRVTNDGISARLIPGTTGYFYQANSYEHLEDGHTTEDSFERIKQVDKRNRKTMAFLKNHFRLPKIYGNIDEAEVVFVAWGSNKGTILETQKKLLDQGKKTALIHFTYVYPMDKEKVKKIFEKEKRYILVENNSQAQFGKLLAQETGIDIKEKILKYDGRPIWPDEIISKLT